MFQRTRFSAAITALLLAAPSGALAAAPQSDAAAAQGAPSALSRGGLTPRQIADGVRYAGTYHVASGTWTRPSGYGTDMGSDVVYSNTAFTPFFTDYNGPTGDLAYGVIYDTGGLPGTTNPGPFAGTVVADSYTISGFQIGYCDNDLGTDVAGWEISFYESFSFSDVCTSGTPNPPMPTQTYFLTGLPSNGCWVVDIDVTGMEAILGADGGAANPGFDGDPDLDSFAWSHKYIGSGTSDAGFVVAGDPANTEPNWQPGSLPLDGTHTYYGAASNCTDGMGTGLGTGYLTEDLAFMDALGATLPIATGCYNLFGYQQPNGCGQAPTNAYMSWHMEMYSATIGGDPIISGPPICNALSNSTGTPATLRVTGDPDPALNEATLEVEGLPMNQFGIFAAGRALPATPLALGNGLLCIDPNAGGGLGRFDGPNQIKNSGATGTVSLSTAAGEWNLSAIETANGTYAAMAGITSYFQFWYRDNVGAGYNFSDAVGVTWQ